MDIQKLLIEKATVIEQLSSIQYKGSIEIKEISGIKYIYIRNRVAGRRTSEYVDKYSDELFAFLQQQIALARKLSKELRAIEKQLAVLGHEDGALSAQVLLNLDFARANTSNLIFDQAILEGIATTLPQTNDILNNRKIDGMRPLDVQKILNLKRAWEFILDKDVITCPSDYYLLCRIAKLINEGIYEYGGEPRRVPVLITGSKYIPPIPNEADVKKALRQLINTETDAVEAAISACLYVMKSQIFIDGNKRAAVIFANHILISHGKGVFAIPENRVKEFQKMLVKYYEGENEEEIREFMLECCYRGM